MISNFPNYLLNLKTILINEGLLCFVFILSTILIGCLFLNKDVEAFTPYRNEPVIIKTVYESIFKLS